MLKKRHVEALFRRQEDASTEYGIWPRIIHANFTLEERCTWNYALFAMFDGKERCFRSVFPPHSACCLSVFTIHWTYAKRTMLCALLTAEQRPVTALHRTTAAFQARNDLPTSSSKSTNASYPTTNAISNKSRKYQR